MAELTTNIYKGNSLLQQECQALLQSYPQNKLPMDKQIISCMSKQVRNTDKVLSKLAYKFLSSVRPLDLVIKHVYEIKPTDEDQDGLASWKYLEEALLSTRYLPWMLYQHLIWHVEMKRLNCLCPVINQHRKQNPCLEENYRRLWRKRIEKQNFLMMRYTSEGGKRTLSINLQDRTIVVICGYTI